MKSLKLLVSFIVLSVSAIMLSSCATNGSMSGGRGQAQQSYSSYESRVPQHLATGEKTILVDPNVHAWGAYAADGHLVRAGLAVAGADYCPDLHRRCHTASGTFRIHSLGSASCKSSIFPIPRGGAPMPYCMFFHGGEGLHGSYELGEANMSHGCVRMEVSEADWMRHNFANVGTKVIVKPY